MALGLALDSSVERGMGRPGGREVQCHMLVVAEVFDGYARVIVSYGTSADRNMGLPAFLRVTGGIVNGGHRLQLPGPSCPQRAYRLAGDTLQATREGPGQSYAYNSTHTLALYKTDAKGLLSGWPAK